MFRFGARAAPQAAFAAGARSAMYMGQVYSRRHFARTNSPLLAGFIDPMKLLVPTAQSGVTGLLPCSAAALAAPGATGAVTPAAALEELLAGAVFSGLTGLAAAPVVPIVMPLCQVSGLTTAFLMKQIRLR
jgi:hypothetical protein